MIVRLVLPGVVFFAFRHRRARAHIRAMRADGLAVKRIRVYPCRACCGWHVGYRALTAGNRITELLRRRKEDPV
jgi:hypothetical protein